MVTLVLPLVSIWLAYTGISNKNRLAEKKSSLSLSPEEKVSVILQESWAFLTSLQTSLANRTRDPASR